MLPNRRGVASPAIGRRVAKQIEEQRQYFAITLLGMLLINILVEFAKDNILLMMNVFRYYETIFGIFNEGVLKGWP